MKKMVDYKIVCQECGTVFETSEPRKYCSNKCRDAVRDRNRSSYAHLVIKSYEEKMEEGAVLFLDSRHTAFDTHNKERGFFRAAELLFLCKTPVVHNGNYSEVSQIVEAALEKKEKLIRSRQKKFGVIKEVMAEPGS